MISVSDNRRSTQLEIDPQYCYNSGAVLYVSCRWGKLTDEGPSCTVKAVCTVAEEEKRRFAKLEKVNVFQFCLHASLRVMCVHGQPCENSPAIHQPSGQEYSSPRGWTAYLVGGLPIPSENTAIGVFGSDCTVIIDLLTIGGKRLLLGKGVW